MTVVVAHARLGRGVSQEPFSQSVSQSAREIHRGRVSQKARAERECDCCWRKRRRNELGWERSVAGAAGVENIKCDSNFLVGLID